MRVVVLILAVVAATACRRDSGPPPQTSLKLETTPGSPAAVVAAKPRIVFLGDSLTAGLGLPSDQSYPALIGRKLKEGGYDYEIVNAGVSGDTSAGGVRRLDWSLEGDVRVLVLALGRTTDCAGCRPTT